MNLRCKRLQGPPVGLRPARAIGDRLLDEQAALGELEGDGHARGPLLGDLVAPRGEEIAPGDDGVAIECVVGELEGAAPAVVVDGAHRRLAPRAVAVPPVKQRRIDLVVAVAEDVGLDHQLVPDRALHREAPVIDLRPHAFDRNAGAGEFLETPGGRGMRFARGCRLALCAAGGGCRVRLHPAHSLPSCCPALAIGAIPMRTGERMDASAHRNWLPSPSWTPLRRAERHCPIARSHGPAHMGQATWAMTIRPQPTAIESPNLTKHR